MNTLNTRKLGLFSLKLLFILCLSCDKSDGEPDLSLRLMNNALLSAKQFEALAEPVEVGVFDAAGNPVAGIKVNFGVARGGGSVDLNQATTNADGIALANWTLGEAIEQELRASLAEDAAISLGITAKATYNYRAPEAINDGWEIGNWNDLGQGNLELITQGMNELRDNRYPETHSMLVIHKGKLMLESYYPGRNSSGTLIEWGRNVPHEIQSASKSFRSMLIGIAIEQGYISGVEVPLFSFFPEHEQYNDEDAKQRITLEHILTMSSGLSWVEWNAPFGSPENNLSQMYSQARSTWVPYVLSRPMAFEPGTTFVYNTGASIMLQDMLVNSIDMSLADFNRTYYTDLVEGGASTSPSFVAMTPRDMARMGQLFVNDGKWKDNQVISNDWIERSVAPEFTGASTSGGDYGYQWWLRDFSNGKHHAWMAQGNGGQYVLVFKELDLVVVSTGGNFGSSDMFNIYRWIERYVLKVFE